jgi:CDP-glucose 4,6-dehydratase
MEYVPGNAFKRLNGPVLITGHTGFKGAWLTLLLESLGIETVGYALEAEKDSLYDRLGRAGKIKEELADIRDIEKFVKFLNETKPVAIFHLAAQPLVLESYKDPIGTFDTNVLGTAKVLEAARTCSSVRLISVITTDKVYRNDNSGKRFAESDPLMGKDPYSASKVGTEAVISAWRQIVQNSGGPEIISLRAGNVIGGGDYAQNRLLPDLVRGFTLNQKIEIRNPASTRPWQHVLDPVGGYLKAAELNLDGKKISAAYNFGPSESSLRVDEVVKIALQTWGESFIEVEMGEIKESELESTNLDLDSTLAELELNWYPCWDQRHATQLTIEWWKSVILREMSPFEACSKDLNEFKERTSQ